MTNVVPIFIALVPSLLHQNHIGVTFGGTSNLIMERIKSCAIILYGNTLVYNYNY
jgi:hypothetical protein